MCVETLVDAGCTHNLISMNLAQESGLKIKVLKQPINLEVANGETLKVTHQVEGRLIFEHLPSCTFPVLFSIASQATQQVLLGIPFLTKQKAILDFKKGRIIIEDLIIPFRDDSNLHVSEPDKDIIRRYTCFMGRKESPPKWIDEYDSKGQIGHITIITHSIILTDKSPFKSPIYPTPVAVREKVDLELDILLEQGIIRHSTSIYTSPAFGILKPNGDIRLVVDYKRLNKQTAKETYPFPTIQEQFSTLKGCKLFSVVDLNSGYYQISVEEDSIPYTSFTTHRGQYEFLRMPFGLCNAPATFCRLVDYLFKRLSFVHVFMDDILIASESYEAHRKHVKEVLEILKGVGATINTYKCHFFKDNVEFLGVRISERG